MRREEITMRSINVGAVERILIVISGALAVLAGITFVAARYSG